MTHHMINWTTALQVGEQAGRLTSGQAGNLLVGR